jgi:hypothetical protein
MNNWRLISNRHPKWTIGLAIMFVVGRAAGAYPGTPWLIVWMPFWCLPAIVLTAIVLLVVLRPWLR